jgi:DNA-binding winged helix-turn-helix (wHTH) protein
MENLPSPILQVIDGPDKGKDILITSHSFWIGRQPVNDWCIPVEKISRNHACIFWEEGRWWIKDNDSKNGTFVNEEKIETRAWLQGGDKIQLARVTVFLFVDPEATMEETHSQVISRGLWIDVKRQEVYVNNWLLEPGLSPQQFRLLQVLWENKGAIVDNQEVTLTLWPNAAEGASLDINARETIDHYFSLLSARLHKADHSHDYIQTIRGKGRRFVQKDG